MLPINPFFLSRAIRPNTGIRVDPEFLLEKVADFPAVYGQMLSNRA
jgi:hypothetical protein